MREISPVHIKSHEISSVHVYNTTWYEYTHLELIDVISAAYFVYIIVSISYVAYAHRKYEIRIPHENSLLYSLISSSIVLESKQCDSNNKMCSKCEFRREMIRFSEVRLHLNFHSFTIC